MTRKIQMKIPRIISQEYLKNLKKNFEISVALFGTAFLGGDSRMAKIDAINQLSQPVMASANLDDEVIAYDSIKRELDILYQLHGESALRRHNEVLVKKFTDLLRMHELNLPLAFYMLDTPAFESIQYSKGTVTVCNYPQNFIPTADSQGRLKIIGNILGRTNIKPIKNVSVKLQDFFTGNFSLEEAKQPPRSQYLLFEKTFLKAKDKEEVYRVIITEPLSEPTSKRINLEDIPPGVKEIDITTGLGLREVIVAAKRNYSLNVKVNGPLNFILMGENSDSSQAANGEISITNIGSSYDLICVYGIPEESVKELNTVLKEIDLKVSATNHYGDINGEEQANYLHSKQIYCDALKPAKSLIIKANAILDSF